MRPFGGRGVAVRGRCDTVAVSELRRGLDNAAHSGIAAGCRLMAPPRPWTTTEVARLRRAYCATPSALAIWRSGAFPDRTHGAIVSALHAHGIYRGRPDAPPGLRRSSTMLTVEQIRWLERRYGRGRRSEALRDIIAAAMVEETARDPRAYQGGAAGVAGQRPAAPLRAPS